MTVCLAAAAGCPEIVVMTPPGPGGGVNPALLHALKARGLRYGLQTMCEGGGVANVTIVEMM
jgi:histidinol dehydrogenase